MVPVVVSIVLSTVSSLPSASLVLSLRSKASTVSAAPSFRRFITAEMLSSGMEKITVMGCSWLITTMPLASPGVT